MTPNQLIDRIPPRLDPLPSPPPDPGLGYRTGQHPAPLGQRDVPAVAQGPVDVAGGARAREVVGAAEDDGPVVGRAAAPGQELGLEARQVPPAGGRVPREPVGVGLDAEAREGRGEHAREGPRVGVLRGAELGVAAGEGVAEAEDAEGALWLGGRGPVCVGVGIVGGAGGGVGGIGGVRGGGGGRVIVVGLGLWR